MDIKAIDALNERVKEVNNYLQIVSNEEVLLELNKLKKNLEISSNLILLNKNFSNKNLKEIQSLLNDSKEFLKIVKENFI